MTQIPAGAVPVCYRHPSRETYVRCTRCDRPICPECMKEASVGHQCPECVAEGRRTQRQALTAFGGSLSGQGSYVTISLIVINVIVMLLAVASTQGTATLGGQGIAGLLGGVSPLHYWGAVLGQATYGDGGQLHGIAVGEYYRLATAMFLHFGLLHLGSNMWVLWVVGRRLEAALGPARFLALYLVAGIGGNVAAYVFAPPTALTAGASTALFGLFGALFFVLRKLGLSVSTLLPLIAINLVITFAVPQVSIAGHLGGLATGAVIGAGLAYAPRNARTAVQVTVLAATTLLLVALALVRTAALTT
jgi:membrane associated rhomboid family serine protease